MLRVAVPSRHHGKDFDTAVGKRRRTEVRAMLTEVRGEVLRKYEIYVETKGVPVDNQALGLTESVSDALRGNYALVDNRGPLSVVRDAILAGTCAGQCPMCGLGQAKTLDHYLPKDSYPEFSVYALNLVPCCSSCNTAKGNKVGDASRRFLHAYFDDISDYNSWLTCEVDVDFDSASFNFDVDSTIPETFRANARYQFESLQLRESYAKAALFDVLGRFDGFDQAYILDGSDGVKDEAAVLERQLSRSFGCHYWKVALYRGIQASRNFCDGGFRLIRS